MANLQMQLRFSEIHRSADTVKVEANTDQKSDSAVFKSIQNENQVIKRDMITNMKRQGLTDDEIRHVFHMDND